MVDKDMWNPKDELRSKRNLKNLNRETYDAGDEATFLQYAKQIQSQEVRTKVMKIRVMLKMNNDLVFSQAYEILEELIKNDRTGKQKIAHGDCIGWEMMGRAYEAIADRYSPKIHPEGADPNTHMKALDRAITCYAKARQHPRVKRVYEKICEASDDKFMRNISQICSAEVCTGLIRIQVMSKLSGEVPFKQAYHILEELVVEHLAGTILIADDDSMAWELIGRAYEAIADRNSLTTKAKRDQDTCTKASGRAIYCYARAQNYKGARRVYKKIYGAGDNRIEGIKSESACVSIMRIHTQYEQNDDGYFRQVYNILEELLTKHSAGDIQIAHDDIKAWQMIGRTYEAIADRNLPKNNPEGNPDISARASARAMYCYARTEEDARDRRIRRTYEKSLLKGLMDKLDKIIADKGLEKELEQIISRLPSSQS